MTIAAPPRTGPGDGSPTAPADRATAGDPAPRLTDLSRAIDLASGWLRRRQGPRGSWEGDYGGPLFLLPMYVGVRHAIQDPPDGRLREEILRYLRQHQRDDGSWGLHVEGEGHVFTTVLNYVALRLLDVPADDDRLAAARAWFRRHGGPTASAPWGKFFLALLNLYDYRGLNPITPELWLLPASLPLHPSRLWCHCRMVYLPMSELYGRRFAVPLDDRLRELRTELYDGNWDSVPWTRHRNRCAASDTYTPLHPLARLANAGLRLYERVAPGPLRRRGLQFVRDQMRREDRNTSYLCIGPINKLLHTLAWHGCDDDAFRAHRERLDEYIYHASDGARMQGYNSSELWDTAFALQALSCADRLEAERDVVTCAFEFVDAHQVREDVPDRQRCFREPSKGGWPFSTRDHGWPITDCTAEGVKVSLALGSFVQKPIAKERLLDAVDLILGWQNPDGGWASYERRRGPLWLERLNPSACFGEIMVDHSFVECSSACVQALSAWSRRFPERADEIRHAIDRGRRFLQSVQRGDGSFEGNWGVCFTYGTWFGVTGLRAAGLSSDHPAVQRAAEFLETQQLPDGGWGELAESCRARRYVSTPDGQAVMTAWSLLALVAADRADSAAVRRGVDFLLKRQRDDGSFPDEHIAGVFNRTCAIHYDNYLKVFPLWALGAVRRALAATTDGRGPRSAVQTAAR